jgi:hypothetical protein
VTVTPFALLIAGMVAAAAPAHAQGGPPPLVLRLPGSARSAGLNGAGASLMGDAGTVFANPVGIAIIRHVSVEGTYRRTPSGAYVTTAAGAWRLAQFDLGGGFQYFKTPVGSGESRETLAVGSLVYRFGLIAIGGSGKWLRQSAPGVEERAVGIDAGLAIAVFDIMAIAFSVQNIGGNQRNASALVLPRLSRFGFTMNYVDPQENFRLMSVLEVQWPEGRNARVVVGGEAGTVLSGVGIVGRMAYGSRWAGYQPSAVTYGGSLVLGHATVDYAFEPTPALLSSRHRFGLRLIL